MSKMDITCHSCVAHPFVISNVKIKTLKALYCKFINNHPKAIYIYVDRKSCVN